MYNQDIPEYLKTDRPLGFENIEIRDFASGLLDDMDYDAQMMAIRLLIFRNKKDDEALGADIAQMEARAQHNSGFFRTEREVDEWVDLLHHSTYQEVAHSMVAVSLLAPLVEAVFVQGFARLRQDFFATAELTSTNPPRMPGKKQWNCRYACAGKTYSRDVVKGIFQLSECIGLIRHLPTDLKSTLVALFGYRNKMFHLGFEWPAAERDHFAELRKAWPSTWFKEATRDKVPWIFYATDSFVDHCLARIDESVLSMGSFFEEQLKNSGNPITP